MKFYLTGTQQFNNAKQAMEFGEITPTPYVRRDNTLFFISTAMRDAGILEFRLLPGDIIMNDPRPEFARLTAEWQDLAAIDYQAMQEALEEMRQAFNKYVVRRDAYEFSTMIARQRLFQLIGDE
jgi:hypothetical protein